MPTSFAEEGSQRIHSGTEAYLSTTKVEQEGHVFTSAKTTTNFSHSEHVITSSVTQQLTYQNMLSHHQQLTNFKEELRHRWSILKAQLSH